MFGFVCVSLVTTFHFHFHWTEELSLKFLVIPTAKKTLKVEGRQKTTQLTSFPFRIVSFTAAAASYISRGYDAES